jgi:hypothetical protein
LSLLKGNDDDMMSIAHDRTEAAGLRYRPLAVTVRDTLAYHATRIDKGAANVPGSRCERVGR